LPFQSFAHALFAEAVVVFPGIVEKRHAVVDGFGDNLIGGLVGFGGAQMISAQSHGRNLHAGLSQPLLRHLTFGHLLRLIRLLLRHAASADERHRAEDGRSFDKTTAIPFELRSHHGSPKIVSPEMGAPYSSRLPTCL
jgi:hypothetical protein